MPPHIPVPLQSSNHPVRRNVGSDNHVTNFPSESVLCRLIYDKISCTKFKQ